MIRVKTILYPTDFSSYSNSAYFHALGLAEAYNAALTILYVYTPGEVAPHAADADRQHWKSQLEQIRPANKKIAVKHVFREGDAAAEIVRFADEVGVDVIVLGTHGRTGFARFLMGSVAEEVVRACTVPVLSIHTHDEAKTP